MNDKPRSETYDTSADECGADEHVDRVGRMQEVRDNTVGRHDENIKDDVGQDEDGREEIEYCRRYRQEGVEDRGCGTGNEDDEGDRSRQGLLKELQEVYDGWLRVAGSDDR